MVSSQLSEASSSDRRGFFSCYYDCVMPSVESIYRDAVMPLPVEDQVRLAELIIERATVASNTSNGQRSVLEYLNSIRPRTAKRSAADIDEQLRRERDSWDD